LRHIDGKVTKWRRRERAGRLPGRGFALTGISVWAVAAVGLTAAHPEVAFLGVIFGGVLAMAGLALSFAPARRVRASYFDEVEEVARTPRRTRRNA
jgi:hypothetical protein